MLDGFEARLADLVADALAGPPPAGSPAIRVLPRAGATVPADTDVSVAAEVLTAEPWKEFGDDALEELRRPEGWRLRPVLSLTGEVAFALAALTGTAQERRERLLRGLDRLLVALDAAPVRGGGAFGSETDRGFALSGFRLARLERSTPDPTQVRAVYTFQGRFWPVQPEAEGPAIATLPTRLVVLPLALPDRVRARAGGPPAPILVRADLRALGGAAPTLIARLGGVAPGALTGSGAPAPAGFVGSEADPDGLYPLTYAPPPTLGAPVTVAVRLSLGGAEVETARLGEVSVEVAPA